jgi:hypothetical protein
MEQHHVMDMVGISQSAPVGMPDFDLKPGEKRCTRCGKAKNKYTDFGLNNQQPDGRHIYCKECRAGRGHRGQPGMSEPPATLWCPKCGADKPSSDFAPMAPGKRRTGVAAYCIEHQRAHMANMVALSQAKAAGKIAPAATDAPAQDRWKPTITVRAGEGVISDKSSRLTPPPATTAQPHLMPPPATAEWPAPALTITPPRAVDSFLPVATIITPEPETAVDDGTLKEPGLAPVLTFDEWLLCGDAPSIYTWPGAGAAMQHTEDDMVLILRPGHSPQRVARAQLASMIEHASLIAWLVKHCRGEQGYSFGV